MIDDVPRIGPLWHFGYWASVGCLCIKHCKIVWCSTASIIYHSSSERRQSDPSDSLIFSHPPSLYHCTAFLFRCQVRTFERAHRNRGQWWSSYCLALYSEWLPPQQTDHNEHAFAGSCLLSSISQPHVWFRRIYNWQGVNFTAEQIHDEKHAGRAVNMKEIWELWGTSWNRVLWRLQRIGSWSQCRPANAKLTVD